MSFWEITAVQYEPRKTSLTEQVAHHLEFIRAAARQQCQLLAFPSLSLLGCDYSRHILPAPPDLSLLDPLYYTATILRMTIIVGSPTEYNDRFIRRTTMSAPWRKTPGIYHQSYDTCLDRHSRTIAVVDERLQDMGMDPTCSLFMVGQRLGEPGLLALARRLQFFSHQYPTAVLMTNARGNSVLWSEHSRLIIRVNRGSLLLVGQHSSQGWQGDIVSLR